MKAKLRHSLQTRHRLAGLLAVALLGFCIAPASGAGETVTIDTYYGGDLNDWVFADSSGTATNGYTVRVGAFTQNQSEVIALSYNRDWIADQFQVFGSNTTATQGASSTAGSFIHSLSNADDFFKGKQAWIVYSDNSTLASSGLYGIVSSSNSSYTISNADPFITTLDGTYLQTSEGGVAGFGSVSTTNATAGTIRVAAAPATYLYWDSNNAAGLGGDGTWSSALTDTEWTTESGGSAADGPYAWGTTSGTDYYAGAGLTANFGGTAGTVTVSGTVETHKGIEISTNGYTLSSGTINLAGSTQSENVIAITTGTSTISSILAGSNGLTKNGTGTLTLSGANTYTGGTTINAGTISLAGAANGNNTLSGNITINSGGTLNYGNSNNHQIANTANITIAGGTFAVGSRLEELGGLSLNSGNLTIGEGGNFTVARSGGFTQTGGEILLSGTSVAYITDPVFYGGNYIASGTQSRVFIYGNATYLGSSNNIYNNASSVSGTFSPYVLSGPSLFVAESVDVNFSNASTGVGRINLQIATLQKTFDVGAGSNLTMDWVIQSGGNFGVSGGSLSKNGTGSLFLNASNIYDGNTSINAGLVRVSNNNSLGTTTYGTTVVSGAALELIGGITIGAEALGLAGTGISDGGALRNVSGDNTYQGAITLNANSRINSDTGLLTLTGAIGGATRNLTLGGEGNITISGTIGTTTGSLTKDGGGLAILSANNSFTGSTTISAGTLQLGASGATGSLASSSIVNNSVLVVDRAGTLTVSAGISGSGTLTKNGTGTLVLSGANSYSGATAINAGAIRASHATALGTTAGGVTVASGAALELDGGITIGAEALGLSGTGISDGGALRNLSGDNVYQGAITLNAASRINSDAGLLTLSGGISGTQNLTLGGAGNITISSEIGTSTGTLTKDGVGTLSLSGANTYSGLTTVSGGTLSLSGGSAISDSAGLALSNSAGVQVNFNSSETIGSLSGGGASGGNVTIASGQTLTIAESGSNTFAGGISGAGGIDKTGSGTLTLSGANSYSGTTTVSAGNLTFSGGSAVANTGSVVLANTSGAVLHIASSETIGSLSGGGASGGNVSIASGQTLTIAQSGSTTYSGSIGGAGNLVKSDSGTITMSGTSNLAGSTTVSGGTLVIEGALGPRFDPLSLPGLQVWLDASDTSTTWQDTSGSSAATANGTSVALINNKSAVGGNFSQGTSGSRPVLQTGANGQNGLSVLTFDGVNDVLSDVTSSTAYTTGGHAYIFAALQDTNPSGGNGDHFAVHVFKTGGSSTRLTLSTRHTSTGNYVGRFRRDDGTLYTTPTSAATASDSNFNVLSYLTAPIDGSHTLRKNGDQIATAVVSPSGNFTGSTSPNRAIGGQNGLSGYFFPGEIGEVFIGTSQLSSTDLKNIENYLTQKWGTSSSSSLAGGPILITSGTLQIGIGGTTGSTGVDSAITNNGTLLFNRSNTITQGIDFANGISGTGIVVQSGSGTLVLKGTNTYSGGATLSSGTLRFDSATALGSSGTISFGGGTLQYGSGITTDLSSRFSSADSQVFNIDTNGNNLAFANALASSGGTLTKNGTGTLTLSSNNTYNGATTINAGTLEIASAGRLGGGNYSASIANSGSFLFGSNSDQILSGNISGSGTLTKNGTGTLILSGANSFTGAVAINAGALRASNSTALGTSAGGVTVASGAALELDGGITIGAEALGLSGTGISSGGALRNLSGDNVYQGAITLNAASRINSDAGLLTLSGGISGTQNLTLGGSGNITISSVVGTSTGTLTKDGAGLLILAGANTYTGTTTIGGGILQIGAGGTSGALSTSSAITNNASLVFNRTDTVTQGTHFSSSIGGTGSLTQNGTGTLVLNASNSYSGATTIHAGTISINADDRLGVAPGSASANHLVLNGGNLTITSGFTLSANRGISIGSAGGAINIGESQTLTYAGQMSGGGNLTKTGRGILSLGGTDNSLLTGTTVLLSGTILINASGALPGGGIRMGNGTTSNHADRAYLNIAQTSTFENGIGIVDSSAAIIEIASSATFTINGVVSQASGSPGSSMIVFRAPGGGSAIGGTLVLAGNNTFVGWRLNAGTTIARHHNAFGQNGGSVNLGMGNTTPGTTNTALYLEDGLQSNAAITVAQNVGYTRTLGLSGSGSGSWLNTIALDGNATLTGGSGTVYFNGTISSNSTGRGVIVSGGTVVLAANNSYDGTTAVSSGILRAAHGNALGSTAAGTTVASGAALELIGGITIGAESLGLSGTGVGNGGALRNISGTNTYGGNITLNAASRIHSDAGLLTLSGNISGTQNLTLDGAGNITISGPIGIATGTLTKNGSGTLILSGSSNFSGATTLNLGNLTVQHANALGTGTFTQSNGSSLLTIDTTGTVANAMSLYNVSALQSATLNGSITVHNATFDVADGDTLTLSGGVGGTGGVTKNGTGTLVLSGSNTYSGATVVNAGTLNAANANALGTNASVTVNGGSLLVSTDDAINSKNLILNSSATGNGTAAGLVFSGTYNGSAGSLTLNQDSIIDLGEGSVVVRFSELAMGAFNLHIYNWTGTTLWGGGDGNNTDQFYIDRTLTESELNRISFYSGIGSNSFVGTGYQLSGGTFNNEVIPVPEPETYATALLLLLGAGWCYVRRRKAAQA